jgi:hypothetical protein
MKLARILLLLLAFAALGPLRLLNVARASESLNPSTELTQEPKTQKGEKFVYADFETVQDNRPVSSRGGQVQLQAYSERPTMPSHYKGAGTTDAPELVRLSKESPSRAITFEYEMQGLNQYAGVSVVVHGQADKDGKPVPDDVSAYKYLSLQIYVTGVTDMSAEFMSNGQGLDANGYPQMTFRVNNKGFNTYLIQLSNLNQQSWAQPRLSAKDVLKKLTAIKIGVSCNNCQTTKGTVVIDNMVFQNEK